LCPGPRAAPNVSRSNFSNFAGNMKPLKCSRQGETWQHLDCCGTHILRRGACEKKKVLATTRGDGGAARAGDGRSPPGHVAALQKLSSSVKINSEKVVEVKMAAGLHAPEPSSGADYHFGSAIRSKQ